MSKDPSLTIQNSNRRQPRYQPMVLCVIAFAAGVLADRGLDWSYQIYLVTVVAALLAWFLIQTRQRRRRRFLVELFAHESASSTMLLVALMALGAFWHHGRWNWFGETEIGRFASEVSQPCCLDGVVLTEPRWIAPSEQNEGLDYQAGVVRTSVTLRVLQIRDRDRWQSASGKVDLIIHAPVHQISSGDTVRVFGRLVKSRPPSNPGQFDFQAFYRTKGKLAFVHAYHADSVHAIRPAGWSHPGLLAKLRQRLNALTWEYINGDEAAFASAILLGNRHQLSPQRRELFLETGTIHLLAISGLHVGILAGSIFLFFRIGLVNRRYCLWATILFVVFYAWLVEFRPPVSRAAILIVLFCIGRLLGENSFSYNLLAIAGLIVLIINPTDLFGIGPQLSFLAVACLTFGKDWVFWPPTTDPIQRLIAHTRPLPVRTFYWLGRQMRTACLVSCLIWLVAMPLVAYRFHLVAPVALLVNPLLLVPIAWALYGGLGVLTFGWFFSPAAKIFGRFCEFNLAWIEGMIGFAQSLPLSHFWTSGPSLLAVSMFYIGLLLAAMFPPTRLKLKWISLLGLVWLVFGWMIPDVVQDWQTRNRVNPLVCTFIDVGHGTSVLAQLPNGQNLLYDAGSFGSANYGFRNVAGVLWHERIEHLDAVILSHADVDHFNALPELSRRFSIGAVLVSPQLLASDSPTVQRILEQLRQKKIRIETIAEGDKLSAGPTAKMTVLSPPSFGTGGNDNSNSVVLMVEHDRRKVLLPGDLESFGLQRLMKKRPIDCDLVMAAHHGSMNSQPSEFMNWSTPESIVISGSSRRIQDAVVELLEQDQRDVFRTDQDGAIRYVVDENGEQIFCWDGYQWQEQ